MMIPTHTLAHCLSLIEPLATDQIQADKADNIKAIQYVLDLYALPTGLFPEGR